MRPFLSMRAVAAAALLLAAGAAQAASVTCQSRNNQREECRLRGRGEVVLVRQTSNTKCVQGRNWDETREGLYVTDGCGGVFETREDGGGRSSRHGDDRPGQGGWSGAAGPANGGGDQALVGMRASSGESELQRRGYRQVRSESAPDGRFMFWRTPSRGCIEVRVTDGRFQTVRTVDQGQCDNSRPLPADRPMRGNDSHPRRQAAVANCSMQYNTEATGASEGTVEGQRYLRPGVWELRMQIAGRRFDCQVNERGQVVSFNPAN